MDWGMLEFLMLALSASTFTVAIGLLAWVLAKSGYFQCADEMNTEACPQPTKYRSIDSTNAASNGTRLNSSILSPGGSYVSEGTRQHILTSHPHFWDHLEQEEGSTYGSLNNETISPGIYDKTTYLGRQHFSYGTLKFHFRQLSSPKHTKELLYQLLYTQALNVNFGLRDIYLEVKCHVSSQSSLDMGDLSDLVSPTKNGKNGIIQRLGSQKHQKQDKSTGEFRFAIPLSRMRSSKLPAGKILIFTGPHDLSVSGKDVPAVNIESVCYMKRGNGSVYVGKGVVSDWWSQSHVITDVEEADDEFLGQERDNIPADTVELYMDYIHQPQVIPGKVEISLTYLPTAEKLSLCIQDFTAEQETVETLPTSELYWKIKLIKTNKRVIRRKVSVSHDTNNSSKWSCNKVVTFDHIKMSTMSNASLVCRLMVNSRTKESETIKYSYRTNGTNPVHYDHQKGEIVHHGTNNVIKTALQKNHINKYHLNNSTSLVKDCRDVQLSRSGGNQLGGVDSDYGNLDIQGNEGSGAHVVLGELYIGARVPDAECRELWVQVLRNSRCPVKKLLTIV